MSSRQFNTVGTIARRKGVPVHRIEYIVHSRGIAAEGFAGNSRVFSAAATDQIEQELDRIAEGQCRSGDSRA